MPSISAVIICYNEIRCIEKCLQALKPVVDEIIICDSFSTDGTKDICLQYADVYVEQTFLGYSEQKNFANTYASKDYILSIDADEILSESLQQELIEWKNLPTKDAYSLNRLTNYCGKFVHHGGWFPDWKTRLFPTATAKWQGDIHEKLIGLPSEGKREFKGFLLHYSYFSIEQHIAQANRFSTIAAQELFQRNKKVSILALILRADWKFKRDYFFRLGLLDGWRGFVIAWISAQATAWKYIKLRQMYRADNVNSP